MGVKMEMKNLSTSLQYNFTNKTNNFSFSFLALIPNVALICLVNDFVKSESSV